MLRLGNQNEYHNSFNLDINPLPQFTGYFDYILIQ